MQTPTHTIETPIGKHKVELREWITGRQREYINEPLYSSVKAKPSVQNGKGDMQMGDFDVNNFITQSGHRELETFVVSVDGQKEVDLDGRRLKAWEFILDGMHEDDAEFVKNEIDKTAKKKGTPTTS